MKCPKCGSQMEQGSLGRMTTLPFTVLKKGDWIGGTGDHVIPFYCRNCGYVEFYIEKFLTRG